MESMFEGIATILSYEKERKQKENECTKHGFYLPQSQEFKEYETEHLREPEKAAMFDPKEIGLHLQKSPQAIRAAISVYHGGAKICQSSEPCKIAYNELLDEMYASHLFAEAGLCRTGSDGRWGKETLEKCNLSGIVGRWGLCQVKKMDKPWFTKCVFKNLWSGKIK